MNCFRFVNIINNTTIINTFNIDNRNIAYIKTEHRSIRATIAYRILKIKPMIKKPKMKNYAFLTVITFRNINSFAYINYILIQNL